MQRLNGVLGVLAQCGPTAGTAAHPDLSPKESPSEMYIRLHREWHERERIVAAAEAALMRAHEVAHQAHEIADLRAQQIAELTDLLEERNERCAELETEVADTLKTLFKSAANPPAILVDAVEFPAQALRFSR